MYEEYWGFSQKPFENNLLPDFLYFSEEHEEALVRMLYTVSERKALMLLLGESGTGKTFLGRTFTAELSRRGYRAAYLSVVEDSPEVLLRQWLSDLGQTPLARDLLGLVEELKEFAAGPSTEGYETILVLDNAEKIRKGRTLDLLKTMLSIERGGRRVFTLVLIGHKVVLGRIESHAALQSLVDISYILKPLNIDETKNYIAHRVRLVGGKENIFTKNAVTEIFELSGGVPRIINSVSDMALFTGAGKGIERVDAEIVSQVKEELLQLKEVS